MMRLSISPIGPAKGAGHAFLLLVVIALACSTGARVDAGPFDLKPFAGGDVRDLTLDATEGALYFNLRGINYLYRPPVMSAVSLADLTEMIRKAETLLIEKANPRRTGDYYNGQTAQVLSRILVRPCLSGRH